MPLPAICGKRNYETLYEDQLDLLPHLLQAR
jgi:hypothetical protein